jgi:hypothetical protein
MLHAADNSFATHLLSLNENVNTYLSMPANQETQPEAGSRTLTQTATPSSANDAGPSEPAGVLKLRGGPSRRQRVVWTDETVDNEGMGKKKSKSKHDNHVRGMG